MQLLHILARQLFGWLVKRGGRFVPGNTIQIEHRYNTNRRQIKDKYSANGTYSCKVTFWLVCIRNLLVSWNTIQIQQIKDKYFANTTYSCRVTFWLVGWLVSETCWELVMQIQYKYIANQYKYSTNTMQILYTLAG